MGTTFHIGSPITMKRLLKVFSKDEENITMAQVAAALLVFHAIRGHLGAMARVEYIVDGPTPSEAEVAAEGEE